MSIKNPYESPRHLPPAEFRDNSLFRGGATVLVATAVGGAIGLCLGTLLGYLLPDYYRSVVVGGHLPSFDPLAVGIGLGLSQGCMAGAACGVALAGLQFWFRQRRRSAEELS
jgi:hypothetical protein